MPHVLPPAESLGSAPQGENSGVYPPQSATTPAPQPGATERPVGDAGLQTTTAPVTHTSPVSSPGIGTDHAPKGNDQNAHIMVSGFVGTICISLVGVALSGNIPRSLALSTSAISSIVGVLFIVPAIILGSSDFRFVHKVARAAAWFQLISLICAFVGAACIVAATQSWVAAFIIGWIVLLTFIVVLWSILMWRTADGREG